MRNTTFAFLLTLFLAATLAISYILAFGSGEATCIVAHTVRLQLNGIEYHIPAALQPYYSPEQALSTRDYFLNNLRTKHYCQSPQSPPAMVNSISFPKKGLIAWAGGGTDRADLAGIFPLAINRSHLASLSVAEGGQPTPGGLFRKIVREPWFELTSIEPIFFGSLVTAQCGPAATQRPSNSCTIRGRLRDGSVVSLGVLDVEKPIDIWPRMLRQVEAFISSMAVGIR